MLSLKKYLNKLLPKVETLSHSEIYRQEIEERLADNEAANQETISLNDEIDGQLPVVLETDYFQVFLEPEWKSTEDGDTDNSSEVFSYVHDKLDLGLIISVTGMKLSDDELEEATQVLYHSREGSIAKTEDAFGNKITAHLELSEQSWGRQVSQTGFSEPGGMFRYFGFVTQNFILHITIETSSMDPSLFDEKAEAILSCILFSDEAWGDREIPAGLALN